MSTLPGSGWVGFSQLRARRLRQSEALRNLVAETRLCPAEFVLPYFVIPGRNRVEPISAMPGISRFSVDRLVEDVSRVVESGIGGVLLFGLPPEKDPLASEAYAPDGLVQGAVRTLKQAYPELLVACDVCLCAYTDHGHCGVVSEGRVLNDPTLDLLGKVAASFADSGADLIAPSDMMDGRVGAIRSALDAAGFPDLPILAYSAKFASGFYGPFREAAASAPQFGDRRTYQLDPANAREALKEVALDIAEGADIVMVKPALAYLDLIWRVKEATDRPVAAFNVSGEYAMIKAASQNGWLEERKVVLETLTCIKRAGADILITYHALEAALWLQEVE